MELILNLVWVAIAIVALLAWHRWRVDSEGSQLQQLIVLVLILAILFPAISMTDDLWAMQNPADPDTCQKRTLVSAEMHWSVPTTMALASAPVQALIHHGRRPIDSDSQDLSTQFFVGCLVYNRPPPTA